MTSYMQGDPYGCVEVIDGESTSSVTTQQVVIEESPYAEPILPSKSLLTSSELFKQDMESESESMRSTSARSTASLTDDVDVVNMGGNGNNYRPSTVLALKKSLKRTCPLDADSCSFWIRNFPSCHQSHNTNEHEHCLCTSHQNFESYANHDTPKTETVIRALIREYKNKNFTVPLNSTTNLPDTRCIDALSYALDPTGSGQVWPEYYFAMAATFGPFNLLLSKLMNTVFYNCLQVQEKEVVEEEEEVEEEERKNDCNNKKNASIPSYFHGYASRKHCVDVLREHCGGHHLIPGAFVLRFSTNRPGQLSISWVNGKQEIKHTALLNEREKGYMCDKVSASNSGIGFLNIGDLLTHHSNFFVTPCFVRRELCYKKYKVIETEVMEEWIAKDDENSSYSEADGDVYGTIVQ